MDNYKHLMQMIGLITALRWLWRERDDYFVGGNLTVYFSPQQKKSEHFRGPDFFVVLGVEAARPRSSWVVWEEGGKYPNLILEILSDSTRAVDRGEKKQIYQDVFRTPEYFLFDPETEELEGFRLVAGKYQPMTPDDGGRFPSDQLDLLLGAHDGEVRFYTRDGQLALRPEDEAVLERRRADEERRRADDAVAELARLRARLGET